MTDAEFLNHAANYFDTEDLGDRLISERLHRIAGRLRRDPAKHFERVVLGVLASLDDDENEQGE